MAFIGMKIFLRSWAFTIAQKKYSRRWNMYPGAHDLETMLAGFKDQDPVNHFADARLIDGCHEVSSEEMCKKNKISVFS